MNNELIELCPICIEKHAEYFTECNHGYCIECLCRIKKCALCRHPLQRVYICNNIKGINRVTPFITSEQTDGIYVYSFDFHPEPSGSINYSRLDNTTLELGFR